MGEPLKPCPFCGSDGVATMWISDGRRVRCHDCGGSGGSQFHGPASIPSADERAIEAWNNRAPDPRIAKLEGLVGDLAVILERCRAQFQLYADEHTRAGKLEKANTNQGFAYQCADFLARIKQDLPE